MMITVFVNINSDDFIKTILLAAVGGISSFAATLLMRLLINNVKSKFRK